MEGLYEWLAQKWSDKGHMVTSIEVQKALDYKQAASFLIVWSIYETKCFGNFCREEKLSAFANNILAKIDIKPLNDFVFSLHTRYQNKEYYRNLKHGFNGIVYDDMLRRNFETLSSIEKWHFLLFVLLRYRNNIFHGNKGVESWINYSVIIEGCIVSMMYIVDHT